MTVTDIVFRGNGLTATFSDGSHADGAFSFSNGATIDFTIGVHTYDE
jgi:hypothetical protein